MFVHFQNRGSNAVAAVVSLAAILLVACAGYGFANGSASQSGAAAGAAQPANGASQGGGAANTQAAVDPHPYQGNDHIIGAENRSAKSVTLNIIGAQGNANSGFNFNGFSNGDMIVKVPKGWKVLVNYSVDSTLYHSLIIVPWGQRQAYTFTTAFPGAAIPDYTSGIDKNSGPVHFSFTADKAGDYALVCAVPGHDELGMWDEFDVVSGLARPEVLVK